MSLPRRNVRTLGLAVAALLAGCGDEKAPVIIVQPADVLVTAGDPATFHVEVVGDPDPEIRWYGGQGEPGPLTPWAELGPTGRTLVLDPATAALDGTGVHAVARNGAGEATSAVARLTVAPVPVKPAIVADAWVTRGSSKQASVDDSRDGHVYTWTVTGGSFGSGVTTVEGPVVRFYPGAQAAQVVLGCSARNAAGRTTEAATRTVDVAEAVRITSFTSEETDVLSGQGVHLNALFSGGTGVVLYLDRSDAIQSGVRFTSQPIFDETTFTLRVTNAGGEYLESPIRVGAFAVARRGRTVER